MLERNRASFPLARGETSSKPLSGSETGKKTSRKRKWKEVDSCRGNYACISVASKVETHFVHQRTLISQLSTCHVTENSRTPFLIDAYPNLYRNIVEKFSKVEEKYVYLDSFLIIIYIHIWETLSYFNDRSFIGRLFSLLRRE